MFTDDVKEPISPTPESNLYFTPARVKQVIADTSLSILSDVNVSDVQEGEYLISKGGKWVNSTVIQKAGGSSSEVQVNIGGKLNGFSSLTFTPEQSRLSIGALQLSPVGISCQDLQISSNSITFMSASSTVQLSERGSISVNGITGNSGQVLTSVGADGAPRWANPSTTPAGKDKAIQFNNNGAVAGTHNLQWDNQQNALIITGDSATLKNMDGAKDPSLTIAAGNASAGDGGTITITGGSGGLGAIGGHVIIKAGSANGGSGSVILAGNAIKLNAFEISKSGSWVLVNGTGKPGDVLTSSGDAAPMWQPVAVQKDVEFCFVEIKTARTIFRAPFKMVLCKPLRASLQAPCGEDVQIQIRKDIHTDVVHAITIKKDNSTTGAIEGPFELALADDAMLVLDVPPEAIALGVKVCLYFKRG